MIIGKQYEPFVIPCKPTSPKVKVELIKEDGEVKEISFDETVGFYVRSDEAIEGGAFTCKFSLNGNDTEIFGFLAVDSRFILQLNVL